MGNPSANSAIINLATRITETKTKTNDYIDNNLSSNTINLIASKDTWIESRSLTQLEQVSNFADMRQVCGMPDIHPGIDAPIGAAYLAKNRIYPALVGSDIGCGIDLWQMDLPKHKVKLDKLIKQIGNIDKGLDESWAAFINERKSALNLPHTEFDGALGTIGGGNHFAELTILDEVYASSIAHNLDASKVHLLIHSGSRGFGAATFRKHAYAAGHLGIKVPSPNADDYLHDHDIALKYAHLNREMIARRIFARLNTQGELSLSVHHNFVEQMGGFFLHRKGAAPADQGLVVIAGNRGDFSYLVRPHPDLNSLYSIAHGAGRKWKRGVCKEKLEKRYSNWRDLERTALGGRVICEDKNLQYEEAPEAYKSIETIITSLIEANLIELVARLRPIITYKTMEKR